jgi:imidazolonepropionase-like amidohydrolase
MTLSRFLSGLSVSLLLLGCTRRPTKLPIYDVVINHVTIVDVLTGQLTPNQVVAIAKGKIVEIQVADKDSYAAKQYVNGNGRYLIPGLWDMHVHFRGGDSLAAANKKSLILYLAHGITTVRDAGGDLTPSLFQWRQEMETGRLAGPHIFTSGPKIDGPGAYWPGSLPVETPAQIRKALDSLQRLKVDYVKIYDSKISGPAYLETIRLAQRRGLKTTGHMPYSVTLGEAVKRGLDATEHLYYVFKACSGKEDSITTAVRNSLGTSNPLGLFAVLPAIYNTYNPAAAGRIFALMAKRHTAAVPTLYIQRTLAELPENDHAGDSLLAYIDPKIQATYQRRQSGARQQSIASQAFNKKLSAKFMSLVPQMQAAGVSLLAGSDSGPFNSYIYPGASLHGELELLVLAGLTPLQALQTATVNGARFMRKAEHSAAIAPGKDADLVLLTGNPLENISNVRKIDAVISRGKAYPAAALANMMRAVRNK